MIDTGSREENWGRWKREETGRAEERVGMRVSKSSTSLGYVSVSSTPHFLDPRQCQMQTEGHASSSPPLPPTHLSPFLPPPLLLAFLLIFLLFPHFHLTSAPPCEENRGISGVARKLDDGQT